MTVRGRIRTAAANRLLRRSMLGAGVLLVLVTAAWLVVTALLARRELNAVKAQLPQLRQALAAGQFEHADAIASSLEGHARSAHHLTTGPVWSLAADIPWLGRPAETARTIAAQSDQVGHRVLPGVLTLAHDLDSDTLRTGSSINLAPLKTAAPVLQSAAKAATSAADAIAHSPGSTWLGSVDSARTKVSGDLDQLRDQLLGASQAVRIVLPMLGESGPQRYFIGFENEAEARGLGGLPGAFAIVTTDHGTVKFTHFENDTELTHVTTGLDLGAEFTARYGLDDPANTYTNSDISPHFPDAAQIWAAMWQKKSGEHVDGAIALDPTALSYLLKATGTAHMADGQAVSASNVVQLTEKDQYARFSNDAERKGFLVQLATAVSGQLLHGGNSTGLVKAAAHAAGERRLVFWTSNAAVEKQLVAVGYAGVVQDQGHPYTGFVVVNTAGSKLDYYLDRTMTYHRTGCGANSTSVATFTMTNTAPATGLPPYVTIRADDHPKNVKPGDNRDEVTYYGTAGATLKSVEIDGRPVTLASGTENGLLTVTADIELPVGASRTITVTLDEPAAHSSVQVLEQPLARTMGVTLSGSSCS